MAKIQANTITDMAASRVSAPGVNPAAGMASRVGAALAAGAQPYETMNRNIDNLTRQRIGNIQARNREMQGALGVFARGMGELGRGVVDVMARRADEQAENALTNYTQYLLAGQDEVYSTAVEGDLAVGPGEIRQQRGVNGPYVAMRKRMSDWDRTDAYRDLSGYAKKLFDEKRRGVDRQFLRGAMERHIAASKAKRDGEEAASLATSIEMAISGGAGITDVGDTSNGWVGNAELAVEKGVRMELRKAHLLDENGEVVEGAEGQAERIREATSDAIYTAIFQRAADRMQQSDDPSERAALYGRLFALVGAKSGHKAEDYALKGDGLDGKQVADVQEALEKASKGYPFSEAAAQKGWDALEKARTGLARRLDAERRAAFSEVVDLEWKLFANEDDDGGVAMERKIALLSGLPDIDRKAIQDKVDGWYYTRNMEHYATRIDGLWDMETPEERKQAADAIEAEVKELNDPKLKSAVRKMLSGIRPASGKIDARMAQNLLVLNDMHGSQAMDWLRDHAGELTKGAFNSVYDFIKADTASRVDLKATMEACKTAGLDLSGIIQTDKNGKPLLDEYGNVMLVDPEGTSDIVTESWQETVEEGGYWSGPRKETRTRTKTVKIANDFLGKLFDACVEWQRISSEKKGGAGTLADYVSEHLTGNIKDLTNAVLAEKIAEHGKKMEKIEAANYVIMAGAPIQFREESDEQDGE